MGMQREFRDLAEQVLFSSSLVDKLAAPEGRLVDRAPGPARAVDCPARPPGLELSRARRKPLPGLGALRSDQDRARILRALANHELLALELFAAALLRFPDAPRGLRRGWMSSLRDEQRHLQSYLHRLHATGEELGGEPLSAFFWDALSTVPGPRSFVAGLQVCLEQANLDFSRAWATAFRAAGDPRTAAVLEEVYEDEVRHLRVGVTWLDRLRAPGVDPFDDFADALQFPLTVARARGPDMDRRGRERAGLSAAFVDRLAVTEVSRGRRPTVRWFAPHVEDDVAGRPPRSSGISADLAILPALQCATGDVVVAPAPSPAFLTRWRDVGLVVPQFVPDLEPRHLPGGSAGALAPWGWSPATAAASAHLGGHFEPGSRAAYSKAWASDQLDSWVNTRPGPWRAEHGGVRCSSLAEVERACAACGAESWVKAAFSTAGQHRIRVHSALEDRHRSWVERSLTYGELVVQPHLHVVAELSAHVDIEDRHVRPRGVVRFVAHRGVFRGVAVAPPAAGLPSAVARFLVEHRAYDRLQAAAQWVAERAQALGARGPLGVDGLVVRDAGRLWLVPISEVNPRMTMGRLGIALRRRMAGVGPWTFLPRGVVRGAGFGDTAGLLDAARIALPDRWARGRLEQGVVVTNEVCDQVITVLWVARRWSDALAAARRVVGPRVWPDDHG